MRLDAFDYDLPESLIAQRPLATRSDSRLMVVARTGGQRAHGVFRDLPHYLQPGDVLVINRSRVIPARLHVTRATGGRAELFIVSIVDDKKFIAIGTPLRKMKPGDELAGEGHAFSCRIRERVSEREVEVEITSGQSVTEVLDEFGHVPLPPYITRPDESADRERYQTVYAEEHGSVAAPTAGLHFDTDVLADLKRSKIEVCSIVLHVGLGTFLPLGREVVSENNLHSEWFEIEASVFERIRDAKAEGRRVIAVGTTTTRVLETLYQRGLLQNPDRSGDYRGETDLFIYPGYGFGVVDGLITNFHLPRSSLLLLVAAFLGTDQTLACYREAVQEQYRFYSYGDAMLIV